MLALFAKKCYNILVAVVILPDGLIFVIMYKTHYTWFDKNTVKEKYEVSATITKYDNEDYYRNTLNMSD